MSVLRDLAIDLINVAKSVKDSKYKLFQLEQLREILIHRDTKLLNEFLGDCISFMTDKSLQIRKFLVKFAKEVFDIDGVGSISHILSLYTFILAECNDAMLISIARELSRSYGKMIIIIAQMGSGPNSNVQESKQLWASFKGLVTKMNEYITSSRSETVKIHCLRLIEEEILFGFPAASTVSDPRLARKVQDPRLARATQKDTGAGNAAAGTGTGGSTAAGSGGSSNPTIEDIPLHHSFISRNELQREAEELFSKFLFWATKGGPQGHPFTATLMSALGQNIASLGTVRPSHCANAATAIALLIQGKGGAAATSSIVYAMTKLERDNLARATHRLLRATGVYVSDPEGQLTKLRTAVNHLESIVSSEATENDTEAAKKRNLQTLVEEESRQLENSTLVSEGINAEEVINAITNAEQQKLRQLQSLEAMGAGATSGTSSSVSHAMEGGSSSMLSSAGQGMSGSAIGELSRTNDMENSNASKYLHTVALSTVTELCSDTISLDSLTLATTMKLVEEKQIAIKSLPSEGMLTGGGGGGSSNIAQILCSPITPQETEYKDYGDLSIRTLLILLDNYFTQHLPSIAIASSEATGMMRKKAKTAKALQELTLRTVLMLILSSMDSEKPKYFIPIVITWSTELMGNIKQDIPTSVTLPREVWIFVSYALQITLSSSFDSFTLSQLTPSQQQIELQTQIQSRLDMVLALVQKLYLHVQQQQQHQQMLAEDTETTAIITATTNPSLQLYESMILAIISRLLQTSLLRQYLKSFVMSLPSIPFSLLALLKAVILTGGTNTTSTNLTSGSSSGNSGNKNALEIRKDCLTLFGQLLFHSDEHIHEPILSFLLWNCLSDDFEIRTRFITLVINDILHHDETIDSMIFTFVIQSIVTAIGLSYISPWLMATREGYLTFLEESQTQQEEEEEEEEDKDNDAMDIEGEQQSQRPESKQAKELLGETVYWSLHTGMMEYDEKEGKYLGDSFHHYFSSKETLEQSTSTPMINNKSKEEQEEQKKAHQKDCQKAMHFLSQLCVLEYHYLLIYIDLYIAYQYFVLQQSSSSPSLSPAVWSITDQIFQELKGILPAISHTTSYQNIFKLLSHHPYETIPIIPSTNNNTITTTTTTSIAITFPQLTIFLTQILQFFYSDFSILVKPDMLVLVMQYITQNAQFRQVALLDTAVAATVVVEAEQEQVLTLETIPQVAEELYFKLLLPIMNGLNTVQIEMCLPRILKLYEPDLEAMKAWIGRMIKPRPPPISKAMILVLLHRLNFEAYDIKGKFILDTIAICLNNKHDFTFEVLKDALGTLLQDTIPPYAVMRTAILTAQSFADMKKYIFTDMIPSLIHKQVWSIAPKVWEGVIYAMKNFTNVNIVKHLDPTVSSLSSFVPGKELKSVLKVAPVIKPILAKYVQSLTQAEREALWSINNNNNTEGVEAVPMEKEKDVEKEKVIKELAAMNLTATTA